MKLLKLIEKRVAQLCQSLLKLYVLIITSICLLFQMPIIPLVNKSGVSLADGLLSSSYDTN